ncbi:hypothetical protein [Rhizobium ruizarguesonis]|jgi:hypothetical protein|uniref:hypothetical protein n=1 Tax=Rhizobium ruizarguesonis TaxID=2081791 RepID=UPI0010325E49|nr:hypothetical protein [Rhizobium ruizarguesonis]TBA24704.1 hypothetical protein ELH61_02330 [Rhizobium ruizarguesonis]
MKRTEKLFRAAIKSATQADAVKITRTDGYPDGYVHVRWSGRDWMPLGPMDVLEDVLVDPDYDWGYVDYRRTAAVVDWLQHRYPRQTWEVMDFPAAAANAEQPADGTRQEELLKAFLAKNPELFNGLEELRSSVLAGSDAPEVLSIVESLQRIPYYPMRGFVFDICEIAAPFLEGRWEVDYGASGFQVSPRQVSAMMTRVFLSDTNSLVATGRGSDREAAVRDALDQYQAAIGEALALSEFRTFDLFPLWQINPVAFYAVENNDSDIDDDGYSMTVTDSVDTHPASLPFVVLVDSDTSKHPRAA